MKQRPGESKRDMVVRWVMHNPGTYVFLDLMHMFDISESTLRVTLDELCFLQPQLIERKEIRNHGPRRNILSQYVIHPSDNGD